MKNVNEVVNRALDRYQEGVAHLVEFEHKAAEATAFEWARSAINLHASFIEDLTAVYVKAARVPFS